MKSYLNVPATAAGLALALSCAVADASAPAMPAPVSLSSAPAPSGIAWRHAVSDADVDAAFALARQGHKPLFLYWGAKWCPPCNHVKATLFNRMEFIERSRAFVPVYIDGDSSGAQKLGARFKVVGYPTMVLFSPEGREITRLPGEVNAAQYTQVLTLGMNAQRPAKAVLADAMRGGAGLTPNDWKLLAFYAWDTDEQQLVTKAQLPAVLKTLAAACPADQGQTSARLMLQAAAAIGADGKSRPVVDPAWRERVLRLLGDANAARSQMDLLTSNAAEIVRALSAAKTPERERLLQSFDAAMRRLQADAGLSRADRLGALQAHVDLAKLTLAPGAKGVPASLQAELREQSARMDREITDGYERQAVITEVAYLLDEAGLSEDSDALLKSNLAKSHSPYYLMSELAAIARRRGDATAALEWSRQAFERAEGPATRLQWGASYVNALVDLSPRDEARIESTVHTLLDEAAVQPNAFYERNARSLQRVGSKLVAWNQGGAHAGAMARLRARLGGVCRALPADEAEQRGVCDRVFSAASSSQGPRS